MHDLFNINDDNGSKGKKLRFVEHAKPSGSFYQQNFINNGIIALSLRELYIIY